jgi:GT2 family glycosyltransferase
MPGQPYIANLNTLEIHKSDCYWVTQMNPGNKRPCGSLAEMAKLIRESGYNGCFYCLNRYDTDSRSISQVLANLSEDLGD